VELDGDLQDRDLPGVLDLTSAQPLGEGVGAAGLHEPQHRPSLLRLTSPHRPRRIERVGQEGVGGVHISNLGTPSDTPSSPEDHCGYGDFG
jgi:hypothetical protein